MEESSIIGFARIPGRIVGETAATFELSGERTCVASRDLLLILWFSRLNKDLRLRAEEQMQMKIDKLSASIWKIVARDAEVVARDCRNG